MKKVQHSLKDLLQRTFIRDGEISVTAVMAFVLCGLFMHIYIKAEVFGLAFSEMILDKIALMFEIVVLGSAGKAAVRQGMGRWGKKAADLVNSQRAGASEREGQVNATTAIQEQPVEVVKSDVPALSSWAAQFVGLQEIPGKRHNPTIMDWIAFMDWSRKYPGFDSDEAAWCSLPPNVGAKKLGLPYSDSPAAKSWLHIGEPISVEEVKAGAYPADSGVVGVYHRLYISKPFDSGPGHVVFFEKPLDDESFSSLEGNYSNAMARNNRRYDDPMFIEFRLLRKA